MVRSCSIIIPTWNARSLIDRCLRSLVQHVDRSKTEIIVVDDASSDDTVGHLQTHYPEVILVQQSENSGFGASCNAGIARAKHEIVILLNNDIITDGPFVEPLLNHFSDTNTFAVNAQVFQADGTTPGGGLVRGYLHAGLLRLRWAETPEERSRCHLTLYANGAATAIDKEKFDRLGGFDPLYAPFYSEDLDISYRAYQQGWHIKYEPESRVRHDHSVTINKDFTPGYISLISKRNRILFVWRNFRSPWLLLTGLGWFLLRFLGAVITLNVIDLQAFSSAVSRLGEVYKRRKSDPPVHVTDSHILSITSRWYKPSAED